MKIRCEDDFQRWAVDIFSRAGHAQSHTFSHEPDVPDLSVAAGGVDLWLELKYGRFSMSAGKDGREYDEFKFKEDKRGQLDWLIKRATAGRTACGIFGFIDVLPFDGLTQYVFYMDADAYLERHYKKTSGRISVAAVILGAHTISFDEVRNDPKELMAFLKARINKGYCLPRPGHKTPRSSHACE